MNALDSLPIMPFHLSQGKMRADGWTLGGYLTPKIDQQGLRALRGLLFLAGALDVAFSQAPNLKASSPYPGPICYWAKWPPQRHARNIINN